jgi:hypothetical protein
VGAGSALTSLTTDAAGTGKTYINGGVVRTVTYQTYNDPVRLLSDTTFSSTDAGNITFNAFLDTDLLALQLHSLSVQSDGVTTFNQAVGLTRALSQITVQGFNSVAYDATNQTGNFYTDHPNGSTRIRAGSVYSAGDQIYNNPVTLLSDTTLNSSNTGSIVFNNLLDGAYSLTVNTAGTTSFNAAVGSITPLRSLVTDANVNSVNDDKTYINGGWVKTTGSQTYGDDVLLGNLTNHATELVTSNAAVVFGRTLNSSSAVKDALTISSGSGVVTFMGAVGDAASHVILGDLTVNTSGITEFFGTVDADSVRTNALGSVQINGGRITTAGQQNYGEAVTLGIDSVLTGASLIFNGALMGDGVVPRNLTVNVTQGDVMFNAKVGQASTPIGIFTVNTFARAVFNDAVKVAHLETGHLGTTYFNSPLVTTTSNSSMVFGNDVVVSTPSFTFDTTNGRALASGANITFNKGLSSSVSGVSSVVIQAGSAGIAQLLGSVGKDSNGSISPLSSLTVSAGGGIVIGGYIQTTGAQTYNNPVTLVATSSLLASELNWSDVTATAPNVGLSLVSKGAQLLTQISITGDFMVTTGSGGVTGGLIQLPRTALHIGGATTFVADTKVAQLATLTNAVNQFGGAVSFITLHGGSWSDVSVVTPTALQMGTTTVSGNMSLTATSGAITQSGPIAVSGTTNLIAIDDNILLNNVNNIFVGRVFVDTPKALQLNTSGALSMGVVNVGLTTNLQSHGVLDMGTSSVYTGKLKVNSGGFEIMQSGPLKAGAEQDFDAGNAKIDLFNPKNLWLGALYFKGGIIMINHPQLLNAVNSGVLMVRTETSLSVAVKAGGDIPAAPAQTVGGTGVSAVSVVVSRTPSSTQSGVIQVQVAPEVASVGKSFSFELDPHAVAGHAPDAPVKITQVDGKPLPNWLSYDAANKTFTAKDLPPGAFPLQVSVSVGNTVTVMVIQEKP